MIEFSDLEPICEIVKLAGKQYMLREATGDIACKWQNAVLKASKFSADGRMIDVGTVADTAPYLVSMCLSLDGVSVPLTTIRSWPQRIQAAIFERAKEISGLDDEQTPEQLKAKIAKLREKLEELEGNASTTDGLSSGGS